jgi:hypothetical protein
LTKATSEHAALLVEAIAQRMPPGVHLVLFMITDEGQQFFAALAATMPPEEFAPIIRDWLAKYDAGEVGKATTLRKKH